MKICINSSQLTDLRSIASLGAYFNTLKSKVVPPLGDLSNYKDSKLLTPKEVNLK